MINFEGKSKAKVLQALYDHSHCQGMSWMDAVPEGYVRGAAQRAFDSVK